LHFLQPLPVKRGDHDARQKQEDQDADGKAEQAERQAAQPDHGVPVSALPGDDRKDHSDHGTDRAENDNVDVMIRRMVGAPQIDHEKQQGKQPHDQRYEDHYDVFRRFLHSCHFSLSSGTGQCFAADLSINARMACS